MATGGEINFYRDRGQTGATTVRPPGLLVLMAAAICVPLSFFMVGASGAWTAAEEEAVTSLDRVTTMLHEHALRAFETHEAVMTALDLRIQGASWPLAAERQVELTSFMAGLRRSAVPVSGLAIIDPANRVSAASVGGQGAPAELGSRAFLNTLRRQSRRVMVSPVLRVDNGAASRFALARRHSEADDDNSALVVSFFDATFFESFYQPLRRERGDFIALLREDGEVLALTRIDAEPNEDGAEEAARILKQTEGLNATIRAPGRKGRPDMVYMVRRISDYPVYLVQGRSLANLRQQWMVRVAPYALLLLTSSGFMILLNWRSARATRREQEAYARLAVEEANHSAKTQANVRMKRMMDANVFGVVTFLEDRMIEANDAFLLMIGNSRSGFKEHGFVWTTKSGAEFAKNEYIKSQLLRRGSCPPFETEIVVGENQTVPALIGATLFERDPLTWTCFVLDLTERREREAQQIFIMRELSHRTKNLLTVIRSIAGQIARTGTGWEDFRERFNNRLAALASSHDLLIDSNWRGASISNLIRSQFNQFYDLASEQVGISGQDINLSPRAAQALGMALYELITNSMKYGALSTSHGRVHVDWSIYEDGGEPVFEMNWRESGGPAVTPPSHRGFGHIVIAEMTSRSLQGEVSYTFPEEGVQWRLTAPLDAIVEREDSREADAPRAA